jgi:hypothetical protein
MRRTLVSIVLFAPLAATACNGILGLEPLETYVDRSPATAPEAGADVGPAVDASTTTFPTGSVVWPENGHAYLLITGTSPVTWTAARNQAVELGGHLVTIGSAAEEIFVEQMSASAFKNNVGPWIGAYQQSHDAEPAGGWTWVTGEPWYYTDWDTGQPNNAGGAEDYGFLEGAPTAPAWGDVTVDNTSLTSLIVEFEPLR